MKGEGYKTHLEAYQETFKTKPLSSFETQPLDPNILPEDPTYGHLSNTARIKIEEAPTAEFTSPKSEPTTSATEDLQTPEPVNTEPIPWQAIWPEELEHIENNSNYDVENPNSWPPKFKEKWPEMYAFLTEHNFLPKASPRKKRGRKTRGKGLNKDIPDII